MKIRGWDVGLLLSILLISTIGIRLFYINSLMVNVVVSEDVYNQMKIIDVNDSLAVLSSIFRVNFNLKTLYLALLYLTGLALGNFTVAGVYLNVLFQTLTIAMIFCFLYYVTRKYATFRICVLLSFFPSYIRRISFVNNYNMKVLIMVCSTIVILLIIKMIANIFKRKKNTEIMMNDLTLKDIKSESDDDDTDNKVKPLDNPLPVPKRRKHKEMDYAIGITSENDDFDIKDISDSDDFDIK